MNSNTSGKIISIDEAANLAARMRRSGKAFVTLNGSFDLLHPGHIQLLQQARSFGDTLAVLLNSDRSVRRYKGPSRPITPERARARMLAGIKGVDYIVLFDDINPKRALERIRPDIHCNGSDWGKNCVERAVVEKHGGKIRIVKLMDGYSTSRLIRDIVRLESVPTIRAVFVDRDGTINDNRDGYIHKREDFTFLPGATQALRLLSKTDYKIIIITNQSGIGRKYYRLRDADRLHSWLKSTLRKKGVRVDSVYICPHAPDDGCECRKPGIGMLERAVKDFGISLAKSWVIGGSAADVLAGREANAHTIKLGARMDRGLKIEPNEYAKDLREAVSIILSCA